MPRTKAKSAPGSESGLVLTTEELAHLTDLMDELAFRGKMQEALIVRIANAGGFDEVLTRIKRRRLYTKRMDVRADVGDDLESTPKGRARKGKGKKGRARRSQQNGGVSHSAEATNAE